MNLYKQSGVGNLLIWTISTEHNLIYIHFSGRTKTIQMPSPEEAIIEMNRRINHRINRLGWSKDPNQAKAIRAMLINTKPLDPLPQEVLVSIKLDGVRGLLSDKLISRRGSNISSVLYTPSNTILDGEVYHPDFDFETISGLCRQHTISAKSRKLKLHVFDQYLEGVPFHERIAKLPNHPDTVIVPHVRIDSDSIGDFYEEAVKDGHEGIIVRDPEGLYESDVRTQYAWKIKPIDREWFTVKAVVDKKLSKGRAIFVFEELPFEATLNFPVSTQQYFFRNPHKIIGKKVIVEFRGRSKYNIPKSAKVIHIPLE
jgi:hypothetical protein